MSEEEDEEQCQKPCDPILDRECCREYWNRMEREGFWNRTAHQWTSKGIREMLK